MIRIVIDLDLRPGEPEEHFAEELARGVGPLLRAPFLRLPFVLGVRLIAAAVPRGLSPFPGYQFAGPVVPEGDPS